MNFLGKLFGTGNAAEAVVNSISNGVDKLFYTDEEKADDKSLARREGFAVYMSWLESTSGSRVARRIIALIITGTWAMMFVLSSAFRACAVFTNDVGALTAAKFERVGGQMTADALELAPLVGVVLLFYFGGPAAIDGVKGLVSKWASKEQPPVTAGQK